MKKLLFSLIFLSIINLANAQEDNTWNTGIKTTFNMSNFYMGSHWHNNWDIGYSFGFSFQRKISDKFRVQSELFFEKASGKQNLKYHAKLSEDKSEVIQSQISTQSIEIPILLQYFINDNIYISLGPQLGYIFNNNIEGDESNIRQYENIFDYTYSFNTIQVGGVIAVSYQLENGIGFDLRYYYGLTEIMNDIQYSNRQCLSVGMHMTF